MIHPSRREKMFGYAILTAAVAVAVAVCAGMFTTEDSSGASTSGECGDELTWEYNKSNHTLTIRGRGAMYDYDGLVVFDFFEEAAPWYNFRKDITDVVLPEGLTSIGEYSFQDLRSLNAIVIPDTVTSIAAYAFYDCRHLSSLTMSESLVMIGEEAFAGCEKLSMMVFPDFLSCIDDEAFRGCASLSRVELPYYLERLGEDAFEDCPVETVINYSGIDIKPGSYGLPGTVKVTNYRCGDFLMWSISPNGHTLAVVGSGEMRDYAQTEVPWSIWSEKIEKVILREGLTYIGTNAFGGLTHLKYVLIPSTVGSIGDGAFSASPDITVYNRSLLYFEPGDFGLSQTVRVVNGCPETISVTFMDGGSVVSVVTEKVGMGYDLPKVQKSDTGPKFLGWFNSKGVKIETVTIVDPGDETVLYARWGPV